MAELLLMAHTSFVIEQILYTLHKTRSCSSIEVKTIYMNSFMCFLLLEEEVHLFVVPCINATKLDFSIIRFSIKDFVLMLQTRKNIRRGSLGATRDHSIKLWKQPLAKCKLRLHTIKPFVIRYSPDPMQAGPLCSGCP